jgi:hypothetical protein
VVAYALYSLSVAQDSSDGNRAVRNRWSLLKSMSGRQIGAGKALARKMGAPGHLLEALDEYLTRSGPVE